MSGQGGASRLRSGESLARGIRQARRQMQRMGLDPVRIEVDSDTLNEMLSMEDFLDWMRYSPALPPKTPPPSEYGQIYGMKVLLSLTAKGIRLYARDGTWMEVQAEDVDPKRKPWMWGAI